MSKDSKWRNRVCRWCLKSFERSKNRSGHKAFCSIECWNRVGRTKSCKGGCDPKNLEDREVTFANGTQHIKRLCRLCRHGKYTPKEGAQERKERTVSQLVEFRKRYTDSFYNTRAWLTVRYDALKKHGPQCCLCGAANGAKLHVDHIKPRSKFPELALRLDNLQVLCEPCNLGKSNRDETDWRSK